MIRTKYNPEKWPISTQLKVDAPEFIPRAETDAKRRGIFDVFIILNDQRYLKR